MVDPVSAFLNVPYDSDFEPLYLAYIVGLSAFGLKPRATLEIPGGERRLDRIFDLVSTCRYSFHDLSRVELDEVPPKTPRFNMPFELGLAVACERMSRKGTHTWFVFESASRRFHKSLSDMGGTDERTNTFTVARFQVSFASWATPWFETKGAQRFNRWRESIVKWRPASRRYKVTPDQPRSLRHACFGTWLWRPARAPTSMCADLRVGHDRPPNPCTYCNKCLVNVLANPLGCYEESRYGLREEMIRQVLSVFDPPPFV